MVCLDILILITTFLAINGHQGHFSKRTLMESAKVAGRPDLVKIKAAPRDLNHEVLIAVKNANLNSLQSTLLDISNPRSENYGKHFTKQEIDELTRNPSSVMEIKNFLDQQGIKVIKTSRDNAYIAAEAPISKWEEVFGNEFHLFKQTDLADVHLVRAEEYSLPDILLPHVEAVFNIVQFPGREVLKKNSKSVVSHIVLASTTDNAVTPALLNEFYSISNNEGHRNVSQAVTGVEDETLSTADLTRFQKKFNLPLDTVTNVGGHVATECSVGQDCDKPNLAVQYLKAVSQTTPTTFMYWSGTNFWLDWITAVAEMTDPPKVMTITHSQYEHEISQSVANLFNIEAMKLSLAGTTIVVAAGDDGAAGPDARSDPLRCGYFPQFPATSPYVTSIGATMGPESGGSEVVCQSNNGGVITSGGGFSTLFSAPDYQAVATSGYCSQFCSFAPTSAPTWSPTQSPSELPTRNPSETPSVSPSRVPTTIPSLVPTRIPSRKPTTLRPSYSRTPSAKPTTRVPSLVPSRSVAPTTRVPTVKPTISSAPTLPSAYLIGDFRINWFLSPTVMNKSPNAATRVMSADGSTVFVTTTDVVYVSRDFGHSYSKVDVGGATEDFIGLACSATCEYCFIVEAVGKSAKRSSDFGVSWEPINLSTITKQSIDGPSMAAASQDGQNVVLLGKFLIVSSDFGVTFSKLDTPSRLTNYPNAEFLPPDAFISIDRSDRLYLSYYMSAFWPWPGDGALFKSLDFGTTWVEMNTPDVGWKYPQISFDLSGLNGITIVNKPPFGYTSTFYTRNGGVTWSESNFGSYDVIGDSMCQDHATGQLVTVGGNNMNKVYSSKNYGQTFQLNSPTLNTAGEKHKSIACSYDGRFIVTGADDESYYGVRVIPTASPTPLPTVAPTIAPTTAKPTTAPTSRTPTTASPSTSPSISVAPTITFSPSVRPTTIIPTFLPSVSYKPTATSKPTYSPMNFPSYTPAPSSYTAGYLRWSGKQHLTQSQPYYTVVVMSADGSTRLHYSGAVDSLLMISRDYGETYTTNDYNTKTHGLDNNVYVGLSCSATCQFCYAVQLTGLKARRSYDFGTTWQPVSLENITKQAQEYSPSLSVTSSDGSTVIFLSRFMAISRDFGVTVNKLLPPAMFDPDSEYTTMTFISMDRSDRLYFSHLVCDGCENQDSGTGFLFKSLDFGTTWVEMNTPASNYKYTTVSFDLSGMYGVAAVETSVMTYRTIYSSDGGVTWNTSSLSTVGTEVCQDHATGRYVNVVGGWESIFGAQNEIYSSTDFGVTFTTNNPPTSGGYSLVGLACSYDGTYVTTFTSNSRFNGRRELLPTRRLSSEQGQHATEKQLTSQATVERHSRMKAQSVCVDRQNKYTCVGRGYPDLAVLGHNYQTISNNQTLTVSSTSASASVVAGMISLVNARRLKAGKSTLGWLNPALYANYALFANDITSGENNCAAGGEVCCSAGFAAGAGWDPVTGLGSVNFTKFSDVLAGLGNSPYAPSKAPTPGPGQPTLSPVTLAPSFPPYTAPEKDDGWFAVKYYEGDQCTSTLLEATSTVTNTCVKEYNSMGVATRSKRYVCGDHNTALLTRYSDVSCASYVSSETYYLGCNPEVRVTDTNGHAQLMSVSLSCSEVVTPYLDIVPSNGLNYAAQVSYATGDSCTSNVHSVAIHVEDRCLTVTGSNTSVIYNFPQRDIYSGTQCETWAIQQPLSTVCSSAESKWLGYSAPTAPPTTAPTVKPTISRTPTIRPTRIPTAKPSFKPSPEPSLAPVVINVRMLDAALNTGDLSQQQQQQQQEINRVYSSLFHIVVVMGVVVLIALLYCRKSVLSAVHREVHCADEKLVTTTDEISTNNQTTDTTSVEV